jgi:hypothetical protein
MYLSLKQVPVSHLSSPFPILNGTKQEKANIDLLVLSTSPAFLSTNTLIPGEVHPLPSRHITLSIGP